MKDAEYSVLYRNLCHLEGYVASARCRAWMRPDVRQEILTRVRLIRDDLYCAKKTKDASRP